MADAKTPLPKLAQLQMAMVKVNGKLAEYLKAASDAITEVSNAKADKNHTHSTYAAKVAPKALTIPTEGWSTDTTITGYTRYVDVTVSGLTASYTVCVMIAAKSASTAEAACLCGACESLAGKLRIRARNVPAAALTATYYIVR